MKCLNFIFASLLIVSFAFGQTEKIELINKIDQFDDAKNFQSALELMKKNEGNYTDDADFLWRMARGYFAIGDQHQDDEQIQKDNYYPGLEKAKLALELNPNIAGPHQYYAILIGKVGELEGTKQKIINSYEVKEHCLKAIELDPENDSNYHVMGRWNYTLSDLSWVEKKVAEMIYSKLPDASFEEAVGFFQKAHDINPTDLRHILWLGKSLNEIGKKEEAKVLWEEGLTIEAKTDSDKSIKEQIKKALK